MGNDEIRSIEHLGKTWRRILDDTNRWRDNDGTYWSLKGMSEQHRLNLMAFLRQRADRIRLAVDIWELSHPVLTPVDGPLFDPLEEEQTALEWLYSQPLWKELVRLLHAPA
jgi:hypothetical protein